MRPIPPIYCSQSPVLANLVFRPSSEADSERRPRAQRVDYKALASGKISKPDLRVSSTSVSDVMAPTKSTSVNSAIGETRTDSAESRANAHAARAALREQRLKAHPYADVRGPELVVCRLCEQQIKLSTKSAYDAFHWNKHIERCARRAPAAREQRVMRAAERKKRASLPKSSVQRLTIHLRPKGATEASSASDPVPVPIHVKEETPERTEDIPSPSSPRSHSSPSLQTPSPPPASPPRPEPDLMMEDYYRRSRRRGTRELSPFTLEAAAAWSWSQVKEPVWVIRSYPSSESQSSENMLNSERNADPSGIMKTYDVDEAWCNDFSPSRVNQPTELSTRLTAP
ncbi:hypothetical protein ACEPAI_4125 [Sanghuangporus weigelae]